MEYDLVIRNGSVVDGSGLPGFRADVGVIDGRIAKVGRLSESGAKEIDADGHVVTPGFIDGHTHMDAQVFWDPLGTCSSWHGVTTAVMGNCGFTMAPVRPDRHDLVVTNLERAEDISPDAMAAGVEWTWETFPQYLNAIDRLPKGINYAANLGHSALRTWAMGDRAFEEVATEDDLAAMEREFEASLDAGAIGFTTSRSSAHETADGRPVASRVASWEEVRRLVGIMGRAGQGIFELALESEFFSRDPEVRNQAGQRLQDLALSSGVPITFGVIGPVVESTADCLKLIESTVAAGGRMFGQSHCREFAVLLSFRTRLPFDRLDEWNGVRSLPLEGQRRMLEDPDVRRRLIEAAHRGDYGRSIGTETRAPDYSRIRILDSALPPNPSVGDVAAERGVDPVELMIDLALESDFHQLFLQVSSGSSVDQVIEMIKYPRAVMTFSDSGAHVSQIMDSSIQTHLLAYWVRQRQLLSLEEAIRMITLAPAIAWGFSDRGILREGMVADLNIFDPDLIAPNLPTVETDLPAGAKRLKQTSTGMLATIVAGQVLFSEGVHTGALPGKLVRMGAAWA